MVDERASAPCGIWAGPLPAAPRCPSHALLTHAQLPVLLAAL
ncbi:MAG: hypothetical protein ACKOUM_06895 [Sphingopyxis sp.]